jgi:hypothetical protein
VTPPLLVVSAVLNFGVAASLGASSQFLWRARRTALPPLSLDARASMGTLRTFARQVEQRGRLNAKAGLCVAIAAACQGGSIVAFLISKGQL